MERDSTYIPMYATPILYDKPKYVICEGFLFEIHGMLISESIERDRYGSQYRETHRTLLEGEQLCPYHINEDTDDPGFEILHSAPDFTKEDFRTMIKYAAEDDIERLMEPFESGKFRLEKPKGILDVKVEASKDILSCYSDYFSLDFKKNRWLPSELEDLFSLQSVLGCTFKFYTEDKDVDSSTIKFMQQITDNRAEFGIFCTSYNSDVPSMNDGKFTYHKSGLIEPMSREDYIALAPDSFESFEKLSRISPDGKPE